MIADAQALTDNADNPGKIRENILNVALDYLAAGLDPEKVTIFIQSGVPQLAELAFYYMNLVSVSRVQRNPTVKTEIKMRNFEANIPLGFFCYPVSQAADITLFHGTVVPVGEDQKPMIELTNELVRRFNSVYGDVFDEAQILLPDNAVCMRLPGTDGKAKMSKSLGNCIYLSDPAEVVEQKIKSMYTDPTHLKVSDPGHLEGNAVFTYLDAFCKDEHFQKYLPEYQNLQELKDHYTRGGLGDMKCKMFLLKIMQDMLEPIRQRRAEWEQRLPEVREILRRGTEEARQAGEQTMAEVRRAMRIDYFDSELTL
jgi:tryptophanyl-tRNA synthetase